MIVNRRGSKSLTGAASLKYGVPAMHWSFCSHLDIAQR